MDKPNILEPGDALEILSEEMAKGRLIPVVGSGISIGSKVPDWDGLIDWLLEDVCSEIYKKVPRPAVDSRFSPEVLDQLKSGSYGSKLETISSVKLRIKSFVDAEAAKQFGGGLDHSAYEQAVGIIHNLYGQKFLNKEPNSYHSNLIKGDYRFILTTNYDDLIEQAQANHIEQLNGAGERRVYERYSSWDHNRISEISKGIYQDDSLIIHMHGGCSNDAREFWNNLILTKQDYMNTDNNQYELFRNLMAGLFATNSLLFLGYGGDDPNLEKILHESMRFHANATSPNDGRPKSYFIQRESEIFSSKCDYRSEHGGYIIKVDDKFEQSNWLIQELARRHPANY